MSEILEQTLMVVVDRGLLHTGPHQPTTPALPRVSLQPPWGPDRGEKDGGKSLHQLCFLLRVLRGQQGLQGVKPRPSVPVAKSLGDKVSKALAFVWKESGCPWVLQKAQGSVGVEHSLTLGKVKPGGQLAWVTTHAGTPLLLRPSNAPRSQSERWLWEGVSGTSPGGWWSEMPHTDHTALLLGDHSRQRPGAWLDRTGCSLWMGKQLQDSAQGSYLLCH